MPVLGAKNFWAVLGAKNTGRAVLGAKRISGSSRGKKNFVQLSGQPKVHGQLSGQNKFSASSQGKRNFLSVLGAKNNFCQFEVVRASSLRRSCESLGMVRVYCAHGFNSAHGVAWCVTRRFYLSKRCRGGALDDPL